MTQIFTEEGTFVPVSVIEVEPQVIAQKKSTESDGYEALQVGFGQGRKHKMTKAMVGHFDKAGVDYKKYLREVPVVSTEDYNIGDELKADVFAVGDFVDVSGTSKGKGYQGVIKRHGQHIGPKGHGSGAHRIVGSMGPIAPNRIAPGKKLPGQMGHVTRTIQNLEVVAVDPENNLLLIKGSVPGPKKGLVVVKTAIKKAGQVNPVHELVDYTPEEVEETVVEEAVEAAAAE